MLLYKEIEERREILYRRRGGGGGGGRDDAKIQTCVNQRLRFVMNSLILPSKLDFNTKEGSQPPASIYAVANEKGCEWEERESWQKKKKKKKKITVRL